MERKNKDKNKVKSINEIKSWFSEKVNKTDKLVKVIKKKERENKLINIRNERGRYDCKYFMHQEDTKRIQ